MKLTISIVVLLQLFAKFSANPIPEQQQLPRCTVSDFDVTVESKLELYIDGARVSSGLPNADIWIAADRIRVPASVKVIGIKGVAIGDVAGILASGAFSTTDGSWKCTNTFYDDWAGATFDDSAWPDAIVIGSHGVGRWGTISGISSEAKWIWTERHTDGDRTVYCRKKRGCTSEPTGAGPSCVTSCAGLADGDYQSCKRCGVYATCSNGDLIDERQCPSGLVWDDNMKRCESKSTTCGTIESTPICITSCAERADGDYQSCKGCRFYATCSNGNLQDQRPCTGGLVWDDQQKSCEWQSTTCA